MLAKYVFIPSQCHSCVHTSNEDAFKSKERNFEHLKWAIDLKDSIAVVIMGGTDQGPRLQLQFIILLLYLFTGWPVPVAL